MMDLVPVEQIPAGEDVDITDIDGIMDLYLQLIELARKKDYPLGISAVQVGIPKKLFIVRPQIVPREESMLGSSSIDRCYQCFINCTYVAAHNRAEVESIEGCLSLPGKTCRVNRFAFIELSGYALSINPDTLEPEVLKIGSSIKNPYSSVVLQHEIDHNFNILISDLGEEI